jgi:hypothetical protein
MSDSKSAREWDRDGIHILRVHRIDAPLQPQNCAGTSVQPRDAVTTSAAGIPAFLDRVDLNKDVKML